MQTPQTISAELQEIAPVLNRVDRQAMLFTVPEGYFQRLPGEILQRISQERGEVPAGYFDQFAGNLMARIRAQETSESMAVAGETNELPDLLAGISRVNPYAVPLGYFEGLPAQLLAATKETKPAKLVSFKQKWIHYAAAAMIAGMIATVAFFNINKPVADNSLASLSKVSDQEIVNYLQDQDLPLSEPVVKSVAAADFNDADIKDLLSDISDTDLEQYSQALNLPKPSVTN